MEELTNNRVITQEDVNGSAPFPDIFRKTHKDAEIVYSGDKSIKLNKKDDK
jgi:hypothetical protein